MPTAPDHAKSIFLNALEIPTGDARQAYLDRMCGSDPSLRAEVEELLTHHAHIPAACDASAVVRTIDMPAEAPVAGKSGTVIGPYKLLQQIGEGGMGTVYMAEQTEPVQRKVALKLIKPGMDSRQVISRFEAERQALALMDHPHIAKVLDAGTTDGGLPYFVMELVRGVPITKYCDEHRLSPRERLELFIPVCQAVQHAHQKGIIHRDIKPSNVLVALYDGRPVPKVIDFGVAKATGPKLTERTMYTEFGAIVGTLEYMSPEQAESNQLDIDTRSDIYSLGVLLYELLTGTTPFEKKRLKDAALMEILRIIREDEPPKPSTRLSTTDELPSISANRGLEPKKLSALVRGELDWIVMKALEKDRNRRYETANGFALDIQRYLVDEPVQACPPSTFYRLRKFVRRNKGALTMTAVMTAAVLVVVGSVGWMVRDKAAREGEFALRQKARDNEIKLEKEAREREIAGERRAREAALNREVDRALEEADQLGAQEKWPEALEAVERAEKLLASADRRDRPPHLVALRKELTMAEQLENIYRNPQRDPTIGGGGGISGGLSPAERSAEEAIFAGREQDARFTDAFREFGIDADALETPEAAARIGRTSIAPALVKALDDWASMRRRARGDNDAGWKKLVEIARQSDRDDWRNRFRGALLSGDQQALKNLADEVSTRDVPPATLLLLAEALKALGDPEKGWNVLARAQRQYPDDLWINDALAVFSLNNSYPPRYSDAIRFYTVASALRSRSPRWHKAVADVHLQNNAFDEAIAEYSRAIELMPDDPQGWLGRGRAYASEVGAGRSEKAIADLSRAVELDPQSAWAHFQLGSVLTAKSQAYRPGIAVTTGQYDRAALEEAIVQLREAVRLKPDFELAHTLFTQALGTVGRIDEAVALYREAVRVKPDDALPHYFLGAVLRRKSQYDEAVAEFQQVIRLKKNFYGVYEDLWRAMKQKCEQKGLDAAIAEYHEAVRLQPDDVLAHMALGEALSSKGWIEEAIPELREVVRLQKENLTIRSILSVRLEQTGRLDEAIAQQRELIRARPDDGALHQSRFVFHLRREVFLGSFHSRLANCLRLQGRLDEAIAEYREELRIQRDAGALEEAHRYLGIALAQKGEWNEAIAEYQAVIRSSGDTRPYQWALGMVQLNTRLPAVLEGKDQPADATERLRFAELCTMPYRKQYAAAARLYSETFAENPKLAETANSNRYNAACAAALAAGGQGEGAAGLDGDERARLRRQALEWLRPDFEAWKRVLQDWLVKNPDATRNHPLVLPDWVAYSLVNNPGAARNWGTNELRHWLWDPDLAAVRDAEALKRLPATEQQEWQELWGDVAGLLNQVLGKTTPAP